MKIGPTFADEIKAAGLMGLPFGWTEEGVFGADNLSPEDQATLADVVAAHDPLRGIARTIHPAWLRLALIQINQLDAVNAAVASQGPVKTALWEYATTIREDDVDVNAVASALSIDLSLLFDEAEVIRNSREG